MPQILDATDATATHPPTWPRGSASFSSTASPGDMRARAAVVAFLVISIRAGQIFNAGWLCRGRGNQGFKKATGAETGTRGATRISGSLNFDSLNRTPRPIYPRVQIREAQPDRKSATELEQVGPVTSFGGFAGFGGGQQRIALHGCGPCPCAAAARRLSPRSRIAQLTAVKHHTSSVERCAAICTGWAMGQGATAHPLSPGRRQPQRFTEHSHR
jgi:hypothetical protein